MVAGTEADRRRQPFQGCALPENALAAALILHIRARASAKMTGVLLSIGGHQYTSSQPSGTADL